MEGFEEIMILSLTSLLLLHLQIIKENKINIVQLLKEIYNSC